MFFRVFASGGSGGPADGSFDPTRHLAYADIRIDNSRERSVHCLYPDTEGDAV